MFSKICRGVFLVFSRLYWKSEKTHLAKCGKGAYIEYPFVLKGGKYISVGDNFRAYKGLRLEAHDKHNGFEFSPLIEIGDNVSINYDVHITACNKVVIEEGTLIASKVFITDHFHGRTHGEDIKIGPQGRKLYSKGEVHIGKNVWIGEGVAIMPGVSIGDNCIIGANSVVTKSISSDFVVAGNPARVIGVTREEE